MPRRNMSKRSIAALVVLSGGVGLWLAATIGPGLGRERDTAGAAMPEETSAPAHLIETSDAVVAEQRALRTQLGDLRHTLGSIQARLGTQAASPERESVTASPLEVERSDHAQQASLAERLDQEAVDPDWQSLTESKVLQALHSSAEQDGFVVGTACRSSHCRVRLDLEAVAPDDRQLAINRLIAALPWEAQAFYQPEEFGDSGKGSLYITREGTQRFARAER